MIFVGAGAPEVLRGFFFDKNRNSAIFKETIESEHSYTLAGMTETTKCGKINMLSGNRRTLLPSLSRENIICDIFICGGNAVHEGAGEFARQTRIGLMVPQK